MNPASRNSNSHVTNIGITSPLGKAKRICVPVREATATVYGALRALKVPSIFYHKRQQKSICNRYLYAFLRKFSLRRFLFLRVWGGKKLHCLKQRKAPKSSAIYSQVIIHFIMRLLSTLLSTLFVSSRACYVRIRIYKKYVLFLKNMI